MRGSKDPLRVDEVDDEEYEDTSTDENLGGDGDLYIVWKASPDNPQDHGHDSSHTKSEGERRHEELVTPSSVDLEYDHVADGSADEQEEEDSADRNIDTNGRCAADTRNLGWVWARPRRSSLLLRHGEEGCQAISGREKTEALQSVIGSQ